jgi:hypothetical protein
MQSYGEDLKTTDNLDLDARVSVIRGDESGRRTGRRRLGRE